MTIVVPLYVEDRYFNILQAKGHAFTTGCIVGALLIAFFILANKKADVLTPVKSPIDIGILTLSIVAIISCVLCGDFKAAFTGEQGWCVGGAAFLLAAFLYLFLSKSFSFKHNYWLPVIVVNSFIFVIGIIHSAGIDVLGLHTHIDPKQYYLYISTIGNINMLVGYLCLIMPMLVCFFMESTELASEVIYVIILALGEMNMILSASDGLYVGIGFCAFFAIPYLFSTKASTTRTSLLLFIYGLELMLVAMCPAFSGKRDKITGISAVFLKPEVFIGIIAVGLLGMIVFSLVKEDRFKRIKRRIIITLEVLLGVVVVAFIVRTIATFDNSWGTNRGGIWTWLIDTFFDLDAVKKIFGVGPEMLGLYLGSHFGLVLSEGISK